MTFVVRIDRATTDGTLVVVVLVEDTESILWGAEFLAPFVEGFGGTTSGDPCHGFSRGEVCCRHIGRTLEVATKARSQLVKSEAGNRDTPFILLCDGNVIKNSVKNSVIGSHADAMS